MKPIIFDTLFVHLGYLMFLWCFVVGYETYIGAHLFGGARAVSCEERENQTSNRPKFVSRN